MNSVQRVRTVNNAQNYVSVVKEVMDVIPSPVVVSVSLVIMVQCVIKNVLPGNGVKIVKSIVTVETEAHVILLLVSVGVRPIGLVKSVSFHVRMVTLGLVVPPYAVV